MEKHKLREKYHIVLIDLDNEYSFQVRETANDEIRGRSNVFTDKNKRDEAVKEYAGDLGLNIHTIGLVEVPPSDVEDEEPEVNSAVVNTNAINYMNIDEFCEMGILHEINRQFLHPLGLALEVEVDDHSGECSLGGIWDYREDSEGILFGHIEPKKVDAFKRFQSEQHYKRQAEVGFIVQTEGAKDGEGTLEQEGIVTAEDIAEIGSEL